MNLWFEIQIRVGLFLKEVAVSTRDPDTDDANLEPLFCESALAQLPKELPPLKIDQGLLMPFSSARSTAHSQLVESRRVDAGHVLASTYVI